MNYNKVLEAIGEFANELFEYPEFAEKVLEDPEFAAELFAAIAYHQGMEDQPVSFEELTELPQISEIVGGQYEDTTPTRLKLLRLSDAFRRQMNENAHLALNASISGFLGRINKEKADELHEKYKARMIENGENALTALKAAQQDLLYQAGQETSEEFDSPSGGMLIIEIEL